MHRGLLHAEEHLHAEKPCEPGAIVNSGPLCKPGAQRPWALNLQHAASMQEGDTTQRAAHLVRIELLLQMWVRGGAAEGRGGQ